MFNFADPVNGLSSPYLASLIGSIGVVWLMLIDVDIAIGVGLIWMSIAIRRNARLEEITTDDLRESHRESGQTSDRPQSG